MSDPVAEEEQVRSRGGLEPEAALGAWGMSTEDTPVAVGPSAPGSGVGSGAPVWEQDHTGVLAAELCRLRDVVASLQTALDRFTSPGKPEALPAGRIPVQVPKAWVNGNPAELSATDYGSLLAQIGACALAVSLQEARAWAGGSELRGSRRSAIQFRLLAQLAKTPGRFVDSATLHAAAWPALVSGEQTAGRDERAVAAKVAVHICRLRARLRAAGTGLQIETGPEGYMLSVPGDCLVLGESSCEETD